jgi:hypothetical protein
MYLNAQQPERNLNFLIYGATGSGKTALGVSAPQPLILLSERQGYETVRDHSARLGVPMPPTFWIQNRSDLATAMQVLQSEHNEPILKLIDKLAPGMTPAMLDSVRATLPYVKPRTVVFDSLTDIMQLVWDGIVEQSPLKPAKDGLPDTTMRHWGAMATRARSFLRMARDLPYHVVMLALLDDREIEGERHVGPSLPMRSLPALAGAACNAIGVARVTVKREQGKETTLLHSVQFAGPDNMITKPLRPLRDVETANVSDWITRCEPIVAESPNAAFAETPNPKESN